MEFPFTNSLYIVSVHHLYIGLVRPQRIEHPSMNVDPPVSLEKKNEENTGDHLPERTEPNSVNLSSFCIWYIFIPFLVSDV